MEITEIPFGISESPECFEKGGVPVRNIEGLEIKWPDPKVLFALLNEIRNKIGFGTIFAEGTLRAAEKITPEAVERTFIIGDAVLFAACCRERITIIKA